MQPMKLFLLGVLLGAVGAMCAMLVVMSRPAHARSLVVTPSAWSLPDCAAEALGSHYVRWTCKIEEES